MQVEQDLEQLKLQLKEVKAARREAAEGVKKLKREIEETTPSAKPRGGKRGKTKTKHPKQGKLEEMEVRI